jgi:quercetin dioxygenase-like cupin family protein
MAKKKAGALTPIGKKIKRERLKRKMTLGDVSKESGLTVDTLKKIEAQEEIPPVGTLIQISRALKIDSGVFLREEESRLKSRIRAYTKRTDNYAYTTLTPGAENKHLKAFKVLIGSMQDHKGVGYQHEGEEFIYVLSGKVEVIVGDHENALDTGESLHFNSGIRHKIKNVGAEDAELLVVIYGP